MTGFLLSLLVVNVVVFVHEFGHLLVAKWCGVGVTVFSVGFGRPIVRMMLGETEYRLCLVLFGGYCQILRKTGSVERDASQEQFVRAAFPRLAARLQSPRVWLTNQRLVNEIAVCIAGPLLNGVVTLVLFTGICYSKGELVDTSPLTVATVRENSLLAECGVKAGDTLREVAEQEVEDYNSLFEIVKPLLPLTGEETVFPVLFQRGELQFKCTVQASRADFLEDDISLIPGVTWSLEWAPVTIAHATLRSVKTLGFMAQEAYQSLQRVSSVPDFVGQMGGPVSIVSEGAAASRRGRMSFVLFMALLSASLGIFNLLPIPPLDGGRVMSAIIRRVCGMKVGMKVEIVTTVIGAVAILALVVVVTGNDILKLIAP